MKQISLNAELRTVSGKKIKQLRNEGIIPLVLYGQKRKTENLQVEKNQFEKVYHQAGVNNLIDLKVGSKKKIKVLIHDTQTDPITDQIIHADIYAVRSDQKLKTEIPLHFIGKSKAVEELEGNLITHKDALEVEVLPGDLIEEIKVDISSLKTFDDIIKISDLNIPKEIEVLEEMDDIIVNVTAPRSEEELEALDEEVEEDIEGVEVEKEKKEEGEETPEEEAEKPETDQKKPAAEDEQPQPTPADQQSRDEKEETKKD